MLVFMAASPGQERDTQTVPPIRPSVRLRRSRGWLGHSWVSLSMRVARHPATRVVVLILLTMFQLGLLWLLGQMVELCLSLMELWLELARKHLEITL